MSEFVNTVYIPMAGESTRTSPLSARFAKGSMPMYAGDKLTTSFDMTVESLADAGFENFVIAVNSYTGDDLRRLAGPIPTDRKTNLTVLGKSDILTEEEALAARYAGLNFTFVEQSPQKQGEKPIYGTLIPLYEARAALAGVRRFLVWGGDDLLVRHPNDPFSDIKEAIKTWEEAGTPHMIAGRPAPQSEASNYGVLQFNADGVFTGIDEKPAHPPVDPLCNTSRYGFDESIWPHMEDERAVERVGTQSGYRIPEYRITDVVQRAADAGERFTAYRIAEGTFYLDTGDPDRWLDAQNTLRDLYKR